MPFIQEKIEIVGLVLANNELENDRVKPNLKLPNPDYLIWK